MKKLILIACSLLLVGCAGSSSEEASESTSQPSTSPSSSSSETSVTRAALEVSDTATCQTLIGTDGGLVSETAEFLTDVSELSGATAAEATALADALEGVGNTSSEEFRVFLTVMQEPFRDLVTAQENGETFSLDASRFKAAGSEVIALCEPLLGASDEAPGDLDTVPAPSETTAAPEAEAPPADGGSYPSLVDLQRAYVEAGGDCPALDQSNQVSLAAESGDCNDSTVISTYLSRDDISTLIQNNKDLNEEIDYDSDSVWLIGQNWVINSDDAAEVQKEMGGQLVSF